MTTPAPPLLRIEDLHLHELGGPAQGRTGRAVDGGSFALAERGRALAPPRAGYGWARASRPMEV